MINNSLLVSVKMNRIETSIKNIETRLDLINLQLNKILTSLENNIEPNCSKMDKHIDFINNIYQSVKYPMEYICTIINSNRLLN